MPTAARTYWLTTPCRIQRQDNSLRIDRDEGTTVHIPITDVRDIIAAAPVDLNSSVISLLNRHHIDIHFLSYHGDYTGSLLGADTATSGATVTAQTRLAAPDTAMPIARSVVDCAAFNVRRVIDRKLLTTPYTTLTDSIATATTPAQLMAAEGNFRRSAWETLDTKLPDWLQLRSRQPPRNAGNAFISYANSVVYARVLSALRLTPLHTGIGFLHSTLERHRHTLALDLAEVFRPLFAERLLLRMAQRKQLKPHHFDTDTNHAMLSTTGRKLVLTTIRDDLATTIQHRTLNRPVAYDELIYLDALRLVKTCLENQPFTPFRIWW
ncbi:CRISPR-associated endonuclease Cas1 [Amycolatopsis anabasis]|uniref:CRISPR-associated endonuclease Cas1 n=1 Tax=Amycolatopsis anabasis TaxID=1840409 RepID=UPI00131CB7F1|nr:CRISPR-associated endonuclease Cas1 [Amycolatopsis anabasis]